MNLNDLAKKIIDKYPKDGVQNMGNNILFPDNYKIQDVRDYIEQTKFTKLTNRTYKLHNITATIEKETYNLWCITLTQGEPK
jgi:hypothetical protein